MISDALRMVGLCAHTLYAHAARWVDNEKGLVAAAGRLHGAPTDFAGRAQRLLAHVGSSPGELTATLDAADGLLSDVRSAVSDS